MAVVTVAVWHHSFDWGEQGVVEDDLEAIVIESENLGWVAAADRVWLGPDEVRSVLLMLGANLLLPGLGFAFSGKAKRG